MNPTIHQLLTQLRSHPDIAKNLQLQTLCTDIEKEVSKLISQKKPAQTTNNSPSANIDGKSGCYIFEGVSGFFCPNCFDNQQQRINTKRLNSKLRVCPSCRASITPKTVN